MEKDLKFSSEERELAQGYLDSLQHELDTMPDHRRVDELDDELIASYIQIMTMLEQMMMDTWKEFDPETEKGSMGFFRSLAFRAYMLGRDDATHEDTETLLDLEKKPKNKYSKKYAN